MKKCAVINDLSGFGKCSLTVSIPILSVMGSEVHPLPTAVLSNQTAYESYKSLPLTNVMDDFMDEWKKLGASFDGILTGFVVDDKQIDIINSFIDSFKGDDTVLIVDPVMADNGKLYDCYNNDMCKKIIELCYKADVITPNLSELAVIAGEKYSEDYDTILSYGKKLISNGIKSIVVTGYKSNDTISNIVFEGDTVHKVTSSLIGGYFSGTGDITASVIMGGILRGQGLFDSVRLASEFITKSIAHTQSENANDGIEFERYLEDLLL